MTTTTTTSHDTYIRDMQKRVARLERELEQLERTADPHDAALSAKIAKIERNFAAKRAELERRLDSARDAGEAAWGELKDGVVTAWNELSDAFNRARSELSR